MTETLTEWTLVLVTGFALMVLLLYGVLRVLRWWFMRRIMEPKPGTWAEYFNDPDKTDRESHPQ